MKSASPACSPVSPQPKRSGNPARPANAASHAAPPFHPLANGDARAAPFHPLANGAGAGPPGHDLDVFRGNPYISTIASDPW